MIIFKFDVPNKHDDQIDFESCFFPRTRTRMGDVERNVKHISTHLKKNKYNDVPKCHKNGIIRENFINYINIRRVLSEHYINNL